MFTFSLPFKNKLLEFKRWSSISFDRTSYSYISKDPLELANMFKVSFNILDIFVFRYIPMDDSEQFAPKYDDSKFRGIDV